MNWHLFNWVDYSIILIVLFSTIVSFFRGFLREAISLTVWLLAFILALKFATPMANLLNPWIGSVLLRYTVAFIFIFIIILVIGVLINLLVHMFVNSIGLTLTDRFLGIFFGVMRGLAVVSVILMFFNLGTKIDNQALKQSRLAPTFKPVVHWLSGFLPQYMQSFSQWINPDTEGIVRK